MKKPALLSFLVLIPWCLSAATITVTSPTATSSWRIGSTQEIRWTHSGFTHPESQTITIRLRRGAAVVCDIATGIPLTARSHSWTLSTASCGGLTAGRYSVRVRIPGGEIGDSPEFAIAAERLHPVGQAIPVRSVELPLMDEESWGWETIFTKVGDTTRVQERTIPECKLGDQGDGIQYLTYLSFDLSQLSAVIPTSATIKQALLMLKKKSVTGSPFQELHAFQVARTSYQGVPGVRTGNEGAFLFSRQCPCREVDISGIDITETFILLRGSGYPRLQVRLQFNQPGNRDGGPDLIEFEKGANGCRLIINYQE